MPDDLEALQAIMDKGLRGVFQGICRVAVSTGGELFPRDAVPVDIMNGMRSIRASELLFEGAAGSVLAVKHEYGEAVAIIHYDGSISPADLARLVQLMFARRDMRACDKALVPHAQVQALASRWKRQIAMVFGEGFASRLVERSLEGKDKGMMSPADLEDARSNISRALGGCLALEKVNK